MGTLNLSNGASLSGSGNNLRSTSGLDFGGDWIDAPIGTIIQYHIILDMVLMLELLTSSTSWSTINVGTDQAGFGIGKIFLMMVLPLIKLPKSHLEITINFPVYVANVWWWY